MATEILYNAVAIKIGKIKHHQGNDPQDDYFLDILEKNGNQQTIATGSLKYVKSYISRVNFQ